MTSRTDHLSDQDFIRHIYMKENPSQDELSAAVRMENMLESYSSLLENIHRLALKDDMFAMRAIRNLTQPGEERASLQ